jgi:hypothetical protein
VSPVTIDHALGIALAILGTLLLIALKRLLSRIDKVVDKVVDLDRTVSVIAVELGSLKQWRDRRAAAASTGVCDKEAML